MDSTLNRLISLRAKDVMTSSVVAVRDDMSMAEAGKILHQHAVSGAPVVDEDGTCIGVLSVADFAVPQTVGIGGDGRELIEYERMLDRVPRRLPKIDGSPNEQVCDHMSILIRSISAEATLMQAAREMCWEHVHRLVVLNAAEQPIGLISTLDIVAATVAIVDEQM